MSTTRRARYGPTPLSRYFCTLSASTLAFVLVVGLAFTEPVVAQTAAYYRQKALESSRAKSWDEAIVNYQKALAMEPNDSLTHYDLALTLKYKGVPQQAVEEFEAALRLKSNWADAHYGLGASLYDLKDFPGSLKELRAAIALDRAFRSNGRVEER